MNPETNPGPAMRRFLTRWDEFEKQNGDNPHAIRFALRMIGLEQAQTCDTHNHELVGLREHLQALDRRLIYATGIIAGSVLALNIGNMILNLFGK